MYKNFYYDVWPDTYTICFPDSVKCITNVNQNLYGSLLFGN